VCLIVSLTQIEQGRTEHDPQVCKRGHRDPPWQFDDLIFIFHLVDLMTLVDVMANLTQILFHMVHSDGSGVPLYENIIEVYQHLVDHLASCVCTM
jgi:hypothetical protein